MYNQPTRQAHKNMEKALNKLETSGKCSFAGDSYFLKGYEDGSQSLRTACDFENPRFYATKKDAMQAAKSMMNRTLNDNKAAAVK